MPGVIFGVVVFILVLGGCVRVVPQTRVFVVERLGQYHATWEAGLHIKLPLLDHIVKKVSLKEQVLDFPPQSVITKDNVVMQIDSIVFMRVTDAKLFAYGVENPVMGIESLAATTLRNLVGGMNFDETLTSRDKINSSMESTLDEATDPWGIKVTRVEVKNIQPPADIQDIMTKQMKAERDKRQSILEAEAHRQSVVARAEGDKQAKVLAAEAERDAAVAIAEGQARSIGLIYEAEAAGLAKLRDANLTPEVLELKRIAAMKDIADGNATKIFLPTDMAQAVSGGVLGEMLESGRDRAPSKTRQQPPPPVDPCVRPGSSQVTRQASVQGGYAPLVQEGTATQSGQAQGRRFTAEDAQQAIAAQRAREAARNAGRKLPGRPDDTVK